MSFTNGLVQRPNPITTTINTNNVSTLAATTQISTDFDIFPVGTSINLTNYIYDGQTNLFINSSVNQTANQVVAQYFDPVTGYGSVGSSFSNSNFDSWNFDTVNSSYLNGMFSASSLLDESTYSFNNLQSTSSASNYLGMYNLDITDGNQQNTSSSSGNENTLFFSLTSQPYLSYKGQMYNGPNSIGPPTVANCNPNYTNTNSDNFLFRSNYYKAGMNEILIVELVFTISNTNSTCVCNSNSSSPNISLMVYNKVISKELLGSLASSSSDRNIKPKVYSAGPIPLQYTQTQTSTFDPTVASSYLFNNIPIILADGYQKLYATMPMVYVPPATTTNSCQYLPLGTVTNPGYYIDSGTYLPVVNTSNITTTTSGTTQFGHFVACIAYSYNISQFTPGTNIYGEILIKNIWRSPVSIYNSYHAYSVNDMATKQVVVLFGKSFNGGTFLVTNTGTPLSVINNYAVTSLRNFMTIMRATINLYDSSNSLVDYFINANLITQLNKLGYNIQILTLQPLLDGSIYNPLTITNNPNMWYMFLNSKNSTNMSIDSTNQQVFSQNIGSPYIGLPNSTLVSTGVVKYFNSELTMLTSSGGYMFGNSLYLGLNTINSQNFYMLLILPEALFNGNPLTTTNNMLSIYSTKNTLFYINITANSSAQFSPQSATVSTGSTSTILNSVYNLSKLNMSVSNVPIV